MDLTEEEIELRSKHEFMHKDFVMFNLTENHSAIRVLTKLTRNLPLDEKEEKIKDNKRIRKQLEWAMRKFIANL